MEQCNFFLLSVYYPIYIFIEYVLFGTLYILKFIFFGKLTIFELLFGVFCGNTKKK